MENIEKFAFCLTKRLVDAENDGRRGAHKGKRIRSEDLFYQK